MKPLSTSPNSEHQKDFWDNLYKDIITTNYELTSDEMLSSFERSIMFSSFIRGVSQVELICYQKLFHLEVNNYLIILHLHNNHFSKIDIDEIQVYKLIKELLAPFDVINVVGPLFLNKICVMISNHRSITEHNYQEEAITISKCIMKGFTLKYETPLAISIGDVHTIDSIYTSFDEALSCLPFCKPSEILHINDATDLLHARHYDASETEKHLYDAIRLRKTEAYDYFSVIMDFIKPMNNPSKRDKILEILILTCHTLRIDNNNQRPLNYSDLIQEMTTLEDQELMEWATQRFLYFIGYTKPQTSVDYSNRIVLSTIEYLEAHYSEEISLETVAEQVNISPQYFSKLIKKSTGFNFIDWLSMLRVKKAKELLTNSNLTVKEVCFLVGYKDPNYFSRIFKKKIGLTPSEFIKNQNYINNKS